MKRIKLNDTDFSILEILMRERIKNDKWKLTTPDIRIALHDQYAMCGNGRSVPTSVYLNKRLKYLEAEGFIDITKRGNMLFIQINKPLIPAVHSLFNANETLVLALQEQSK